MSDTQFSQEHYPVRSRVVHLTLWVLLTVINVFLVAKFAPELLRFHRNDFPDGASANTLGAIFNVAITLNSLGFILGSLLAVLPIGNRKYSKRYVRISFFTMILLQAGVTTYVILKLSGVIQPI